MINVKLPDGRTVSVDTDDRAEAARAAQKFMSQTGDSVDASNTSGGAHETFLNAVTLGLSDEAAGAGRAAGQAIRGLFTGEEGDATGAFQRGADPSRQAVDRFSEENPVSSAVLSVIGGLGGGAAGKALTAAPGVLRNVGRAAVSGGVFGGVSGFGNAEGGAAERLDEAATGAALGATLSGGVAAAVPLVGGVFRFLTGPFKNPERAAKRLVIRSMQRDGLTPEKAGQLYDDWVTAGAKPANLADIAGENTRGLLRAAQATPGSAKSRAFELLTQRQEAQGLRLEDDLASTLRLEKRGFFDVIDDLKARRSSEAAPLYERAFARENVWSDELSELTQRPSMSLALKRARQIVEEEGGDLPGVFTTGPKGQITGIDEIPDLRTWHMMKMGLDDILEGFRDNVTGRLVLDNRGRAINETRKALNTALEGLDENYARAQSIWAGDSSALSAMDRGRQFMLRDAEITRDTLESLTSADREFFRIGAYRQLVDRIRSKTDGADKARELFGTAAKRDRLKEIFPDEESFKAFEVLVRQELRMTQTARTVTGGSPTARITEEVADMADDPGFLDLLLAGNWKGAAQMGALRFARSGRGLTSEAAGEVGEILADPQAARPALEGLAAEAASVQQRANRGAAGLAASPLLVGNTSGRVAAQ